MYIIENILFYWFIFKSSKKGPTTSSLHALLPVQRHVLRFLSEPRVKFIDVVHGSSLTASTASALRLQLCFISWKISHVLILTNYQLPIQTFLKGQI